MAHSLEIATWGEVNQTQLPRHWERYIYNLSKKIKVHGSLMGSGHLEQLWMEKWCVVPSPMSLWTWNQQQCDIDHAWHWQRRTYPQNTRKQRMKQVKPYKQQQNNIENPKHTLQKTKVWNFQLSGNRTLKLEGGKGKLRCWHDKTYQRERER